MDFKSYGINQNALKFGHIFSNFSWRFSAVRLNLLTSFKVFFNSGRFFTILVHHIVLERQRSELDILDFRISQGCVLLKKTLKNFWTAPKKLLLEDSILSSPLQPNSACRHHRVKKLHTYFCVGCDFALLHIHCSYCYHYHSNLLMDCCNFSMFSKLNRQ